MNGYKESGDETTRLRNGYKESGDETTRVRNGYSRPGSMRMTSAADRFSEGNLDDVAQDETFSVSHAGAGLSTRTLPAKMYTKLETISGHVIRRMMFAHNMSMLFGALYCTVLIILCRTAWLAPEGYGSDGSDTDGDFRAAIYPDGYIIAAAAFTLAAFAYILVLTVFYWKRIITQYFKSKDVTNEMVWVLVLTLAMCVYLNPYMPVSDIYHRTGDRVIQSNLQKTFSIMYNVQALAFSISTIWYIWATAHSYRYLDKAPGWWFYTPKILVLAALTVIRIAAMPDPLQIITFHEMPLVTGIRFLAYIAQDAAKLRTSAKPTYMVIALSAVEIVAVFWTIVDVLKTRLFLKRKDYMWFRSKQIGFRFFVYFNLTFYSVYWILSVLVACLAVSNDFYLPIDQYYNFGMPSYIIPGGMLVMIASYMTVTSTVNLPAQFKSRWYFFGCEQCVRSDSGSEKPKDDDVEPITYRSTEPPSFQGSVESLPSNCFTMQTHVIMFNFAWLVYYYGTKKYENLQLKQDVFKFEIAAYFADKPTDTHAIVVDGEDRIVVSFRGTASTRNLRTDVRIAQRALNQVIPTKKMAQPPQDVVTLMTSKKWRGARVHSGFAAAYLSISYELVEKVRELYQERRRPIYLTGHSLGGCLATMCALDLYLTLGLNKREIFVSTFGSPRLGNQAFAEIYDEAVPSSWRIIVGPDMVTKLPRFGYKHCSKKVLLTVSGDLFIDPNALELRLWSGEKPGMLFHRKASYLLAMRAWCEVNHGGEYDPEFWAWPFRPDDSRRFSHVLNAQSKTSSAYSSKRTRNKENRGIRLLQRDDLISQLDKHSSKRSTTEMWADLTRKLLAETEADNA